MRLLNWFFVDIIMLINITFQKAEFTCYKFHFDYSDQYGYFQIIIKVMYGNDLIIIWYLINLL